MVAWMLSKMFPCANVHWSAVAKLGPSSPRNPVNVGMADKHHPDEPPTLGMESGPGGKPNRLLQLDGMHGSLIT